MRPEYVSKCANFGGFADKEVCHSSLNDDGGDDGDFPAPSDFLLLFFLHERLLLGC